MITQTNELVSRRNISSNVEDECLRDNVLSEIDEYAKKNSRCILVTSEPFYGKTTVLRQFYKQNLHNAAIYYVKDDLYRDKIEYIIKDICEQLLQFTSEKTFRRLDKLDIDSIPMHQAIQVFEKIYNDLCKQVTREQKKFFLIIDGLDKLSDEVYSGLLEVIPPGDSNGFHIIFSLDIHSPRILNREYSSVKVGKFSLSETRDLFSPYINDRNKIDYIHDFCNGIPGYVTEILQNIKENPKILELENLNDYINFESRLDKIWSELNLSNEVINFMSLIAFAPEKLVESQIKEILSLEDDLDYLIEDIHFIRKENDIIFYPEIYKRYITEKLSVYKPDAIKLLIEFYQNKEKNLQSILYLSNLYVEDNNYDKLKDLLSTKTIANSVKDLTGTELLRENITLLLNMSLENKDWGVYLNALLTDSIISEIVQTPPTIENDIRTLLALKEYQDSINLASLCSLEEDRCLLLSIICKCLKKDEINIPQEFLDEIKNSFNKSSEFNSELLDKWIAICTNLFPIDMQLSMDIVKELAERSNFEISKEKLMDHLLLKVFLNLGEENDSETVGAINDITKEIDNSELRDFLNINTSDQENTFIEVLSKIENIGDVSAKIFYINSWCLNNKGNPEVINVIYYILDKFKKDMNYTLSIRDLRILTEAANSIEDIGNLNDLLNKFEFAENSTTKSPIHENIRFQLMLVQLESRNDLTKAKQRYLKTIQYSDDIQESDIKAFSYVMLLKYYVNLYNESETELYDSLRKKVIETFNIIFLQSALQSKVIVDTFYELSVIDYQLSLDLAKQVNTEKN
ncbi:hypothetical protein NXZ75_05420, partial [Lysinibacillus sphaericus]|uniref:hypothetical protein n=1 Tax=Lysinibacillus sphaericus TaxID=1421 RepID=UPI002162B5EA